MKTKAFLLALTLAAAAVLPSAALADSGPALYVSVTASSLRVRKGPSSRSAQIGSLKKGAEARYMGSDGPWMCVLLEDGSSGWIYEKYAVLLEEGDLPEDVESGTIGNVAYTAHVVRADGWNDYELLEPAVIRSLEELEALEPLDGDPTVANFDEARKLIKTYDAEYFQSGKALIVFSQYAGSGSVRFAVRRAWTDADGVWNVDVTRALPEIGTDDMAEWLFFLEVDAADLSEDAQVRINTQSIDPYTAAIDLESNPTTGYEWTYTVSREGIVEETKNEYIADEVEGDIVGAGGVHSFQFRGLKAGTVALTFRYARPWEKGEAAKVATYQITVDESLQITCEEYFDDCSGDA